MAFELMQGNKCAMADESLWGGILRPQGCKQIRYDRTLLGLRM